MVRLLKAAAEAETAVSRSAVRARQMVHGARAGGAGAYNFTFSN